MPLSWGLREPHAGSSSPELDRFGASLVGAGEALSTAFLMLSNAIEAETTTPRSQVPERKGPRCQLPT